MLYILSGFIFGCLIPYLARRLGKLMPATMGYILLKIFIPQHCMPWNKLKNDFEYMQLFKSYMKAILNNRNTQKLFAFIGLQTVLFQL